MLQLVVQLGMARQWQMVSEVRDEGNDSVANGGDYTDTYTLDLVGNRTQKIRNAADNAKDATINSTYNERDQLTSSAGDPTGSISYTYDDNGSQLTKIQGGVTTVYKWDLQNHLVSLDNTTNGAVDVTYRYNSAGVRVAESANGTTIYYLNDPQNPTGYTKAIEDRSDTNADGTADTAQTAYLLGLQVIGQADASGSHYLLLDGHGSTRAVTNISGSIGYQYDSVGRLSSVIAKASSTAMGQVTSYHYDPITGRLASVTDPLGGSTSYGYDAAGRRTDRTLPNGVHTTWTYNDADQVTDLVHENASGTVLASFHYDRTPEGVPTQITREDGTYVVYGYDDALRLASETYHASDGAVTRTISYTYDAAGNRTSKTDSAAGGTLDSHLLSGYRLDTVTDSSGAGVEDYSYDLDGNVTGISRDGQSYSLAYNTAGQVTGVSGSASMSYNYDGNGNRVAITSGSQQYNLVLNSSTR